MEISIKQLIMDLKQQNMDDVYLGSTCDTLVKRFSILKVKSKL